MAGFNTRNGGAALRRARIEAGFLTLPMVTKKSVEIWGEKHKIVGAEISRVELARKDRPSAPLLGQFSYLYRKPLEQIYEWFGYPYYGGVAPSEDQRVTYAKTVADSLSPGEREELYDAILLAAQYAEFQSSKKHQTVNAR